MKGPVCCKCRLCLITAAASSEGSLCVCMVLVWLSDEMFVWAAMYCSSTCELVCVAVVAGILCVAMKGCPSVLKRLECPGSGVLKGLGCPVLYGVGGDNIGIGVVAGKSNNML